MNEHDHEVLSRNDILSPPAPSSLPPQGKIIREIMHGVRDLALPAMCLISMKLGFEQGGWLFAASVLVVIGGNMGARKADGALDVHDLIALIKR